MEKRILILLFIVVLLALGSYYLLIGGNMSTTSTTTLQVTSTLVSPTTTRMITRPTQPTTTLQQTTTLSGTSTTSTTPSSFTNPTTSSTTATTQPDHTNPQTTTTSTTISGATTSTTTQISTTTTTLFGTTTTTTATSSTTLQSTTTSSTTRTTTTTTRTTTTSTTTTTTRTTTLATTTTTVPQTSLQYNYGYGDLANMIMLPKNNIFYARVDSLPLDPRSATWIANDFTGVSDGLRWYSAEQYNAIHANSITPQYLNPFVLGDNIAYPIPNNPRINPYDYDHVLMMYDIDNGMFYNLYATYPGEGGGWTASASQWNDMKTNDLRVSSALRPPEGVLQVKYDEVASGKVNHALQFSLKHTSDAYVWPYFHSNGDPYPISQYPPVGQRFRLKASYDISRLGPEARVIAQALKTYGGIVTDQHGSEANIVQINANYDSRWAGSLGDEIWDDLASIPTNQFEAVDCSSLMVSPNSMEVAA